MDVRCLEPTWVKKATYLDIKSQRRRQPNSADYGDESRERGRPYDAVSVKEKVAYSKPHRLDHQLHMGRTGLARPLTGHVMSSMAE